MADTAYLAAAMNRVVSMEKEAVVATYPGVNAYPYLFHFQETFPYWTNALGPNEPRFDSELLSVRTYTVTARFIIGHLTEGYFGDLEATLYTDIPTIENFFMQRNQLTNTEYPNPLDQLSPVGIAIAVTQGLTVFENSGIPVRQIGTEFRILLPFNITVEQLD